MTSVFADTYYYLALINRKDKAHGKAVAFSQAHGVKQFTTAWVLTEVADALSNSAHRAFFLKLLHQLRADSETVLIGPSDRLYELGLALYESRPDKDWSLTDCISFAFMTEQHLTDALTGDHHFEQAGFNALLK